MSLVRRFLLLPLIFFNPEYLEPVNGYKLMPEDEDETFSGIPSVSMIFSLLTTDVLHTS
jgi:hypothetical protein